VVAVSFFRLTAEKNVTVAPSFPQTWNVDLFYNGPSQIIALASEERSLISIFLPLTRSKDPKLFFSAFEKRLSSWFDNVSAWYPSDIGRVRFAARTNRSLIGSQNDFIHVAKLMLQDFEQPIGVHNMLKVEEEINAMPMSYLGMDWPSRAMWKAAKGQTHVFKGAPGNRD
jgi:hypothetical protein